MTISYFVRYQGLGTALESFDQYYCETHAKILAQFPDIRSLNVHRPVDLRDPFATSSDPTDFLAQMTFDSAEALTAALRSDIRARAREDFANLPTAGGPVPHQAMATRRLL